MAEFTPADLEAARAAANEFIKKPYDQVVTQDIREDDGVLRSMSLHDYAQKGIGTSFRDAADLVRQYYTSAPNRAVIKKYSQIRDQESSGSAYARSALKTHRDALSDRAAEMLGITDSTARFDNWIMAISKLSDEGTRASDIDARTMAALQQGKELLQVITQYSKREQQQLEDANLSPPDMIGERVTALFKEAVQQLEDANLSPPHMIGERVTALFEEAVNIARRNLKDECPAQVPDQNPSQESTLRKNLEEAGKWAEVNLRATQYLREKLYGGFSEDFLAMTNQVMERLHIPSLPDPKLPGGVTV